MLVMLACGALLLLAVGAGWQWRRHALAIPGWARDELDTRSGRARCLVWFLAVAVLTGLAVGVFVVGPAGRLAMRLLAATSPDAQGRITEADQIVGQISLTGTIGFVLFVGLPFGLAAGLAYALASFVVPRGLLGGALFGLAALVVVGAVVDPLRGDNPDFAIVGPGWLSITTFAVMAVLAGALTAPIAGRLGAAIGRPSHWWWLWLVPLDLFTFAALSIVSLVFAGIVAACLAVLALVLVLSPWSPAFRRRTAQLGRALASIAVLVSVPGFVSALAAIVD
ncbi:hypothetical protein [Terrabacter sp. NPDC080008]|uniref:hypothetical protein n=1 Tax=Terrabacter sp. NPDC080008 TaxID=3155176 RepID=UPI00344B616C